MRMEDTPYDVAMTLSKQELARQVVECNTRIEALEYIEVLVRNRTLTLEKTLQTIAKQKTSDELAPGLDSNYEGSHDYMVRIARLALAPD